MGVVFDKLGFMRKLEGEQGFTRPQAERLTDAFYDAIVESVATKQDVGDVRTELRETRTELKHETAELRTELRETRAELRHEIAELRSEMKHEFSQVRSEMTVMRSEFRSDMATLKVWAAGTGAAVVSLLSALKFFS